MDMVVDTAILERIKQVVRFYETGKTKGADYSCLSLYHDGPNHRLQITYGAFQTTEFGHLRSLIKQYIEAGGMYGKFLYPRLSEIGNLNKPSLANNLAFVQQLKLAATDPIMHKVQDKFFDEYYFQPALTWCKNQGFTLALSLLIIFDSFVHSGGILTFLRERFRAVPPSKGGDEKQWITEYVSARDAWLENNTLKLLQQTDYRTDSFIYAIKTGNWDLTTHFEVVNYADKDEKTSPEILSVIC